MHVTHSRVCPQKKSPVINGPEGQFSTGLLGADNLLWMIFSEYWIAGRSFLQAKKSRSSGSGLGTADCGLLADAEAREDPPQQVIRAERTGDFAEGLLSLAQVFGEQFAGARER